ncbi:MAG TPA: protein kinase [Kofleriaceae bacterium]|nr:protein kinase [Kofleriaceae bacterium]
MRELTPGPALEASDVPAVFPNPDPERCLTCGRRFRGEHPGCAVRPLASDDERAAESALSALPRIPGYEVERVLGVGGHGAVLRARRQADGLLCAIKMARADAASGARRLRAERRVLEAVPPPHVPRLIEALEAGGALYLVFELIGEPTLAARLAGLAAPMPEAERQAIARALFSAVEAMHERGFVHADLKPENVFVRASGEVTLIDFGTARGPGIAVADEGPVGTVEYMAPQQLSMAPEQVSAAGPLDVRADVYALGVLLFELWTLRVPFWGTSAEVRVAVESRRPPRPSSFGPIAPAVEEVILRALAKSPGDRWPSVAALRQALERAFEEQRAPAAAASVAAAAPAAPSPPAAAAVAAVPGKDTRVQRNLPLIAFVSQQSDAKAVERELARLDAFVTSVSGASYVAVVDSESNETPLDHALAAARRIVMLGIARGVLVDVAPVRVRLGGPVRRYHSAALALLVARLGGAHREGVVLTAGVAAMMHAGRTRPLGSEEFQLVDPESDLSLAEPPSLVAEALPFVGRDEEMTRLVRGGEAAFAERVPTLVTIRGDAGIGKTRLTTALRQKVGQVVPSVRVLAFRGQDPSVGEVDETLRAILRRLVLISGAPTPGPEACAHVQAQVGDAWPAVALTLGWIGHDAPELEPLAQAPGALRIATVEATARLIRRAAEQAPLGIIVDDAHQADATALDAIELATLDRAGAVPLWICVLVRPSFEALRPGWGERAERAESLELSPLSQEAAEELCRILLQPAENLPAKLLEVITERAHGNAMLLGELCRALKNEGIVRRERTGAWILETDRVEAWPHTLRLAWLAERELGRLPLDLASHAQLAALLGPKFPVRDMIGVMRVLETSLVARQFPLDAKVALTQLERAQLLRIRGRGDCEFRNAMLCEAMRATIPEPLRIELHRAAFAHYRDRGTAADERQRSRLAYHAAEAGLREPAAMVYEALAAEDLYRHRYVEAERSFSRVLGLVDSAPQRLTAQHGRGLARYRLGRYEDALSDLHQAYELAAELGDRRARLTILLDEATVLDWLWNLHRSAELVDQATALAGDDTEPVIAARLAMGRARSLWRLGKSVEARASLREAIARAEAAGPAAYESLIVSLVMLGDVLSNLGEIREARQVFDRILAMAHAQGDRIHELAALNNRRLVWIAEKDVARATADLQALLEIGRTLGLVLVELVGTYNLGELLYQADDAAAARPYVERAVALSTRRPDLLPRPVARLLELRLLAFEGRWQETEALGASLVELQRAAQAEGRSDAQLLPSELVLLDAIRLASAGGTAEAWAEAWADVRERSKRYSEEQQAIEVIEMQALGALRVGDVAAARRSLGEALEVARAIPNVMEPRLRHRLAAIEARSA